MVKKDRFDPYYDWNDFQQEVKELDKDSKLKVRKTKIFLKS